MFITHTTVPNCVLEDENLARQTEKYKKLMSIVDESADMVEACDEFELAKTRMNTTATEKVHQIYKFYLEYQDDEEISEIVLELLKEAKRKGFEDDTLYQQILRLIFTEKQRTTASRYAKAIQNALNDDIPEEEFKSWVKNKGGINKAAGGNAQSTGSNDYKLLAEQKVLCVQAEAMFEWPTMSKSYIGTRALVLVDVDESGKIKVLAADDNKDIVEKYVEHCGREYSRQVNNSSSKDKLNLMRERLKEQ